MKSIIKIKEKMIRKFFIYTWEIFEKLGFYIVPKHFYFPIPEKKDLETYDYDHEFSLCGLKINDKSMKTLLQKIKFYNKEYISFYMPSGYEINGDGSILFGMVRILKPKKIIEIGGVIPLVYRIMLWI